jgi:hypothetical protein
MNTLLLDRTAWDLVEDAQGNIAMASNPYALAQDVASAIKLFKGECFYDVSRGIPYWQQILGQWPPLAVIRAYVESAALTVPGVVKAQCKIVQTADRTITGQVEITDAAGVAQNVTF